MDSLKKQVAYLATNNEKLHQERTAFQKNMEEKFKKLREDGFVATIIITIIMAIIITCVPYKQLPVSANSDKTMDSTESMDFLKEKLGPWQETLEANTVKIKELAVSLDYINENSHAYCTNKNNIQQDQIDLHEMIKQELLNVKIHDSNLQEKTAEKITILERNVEDLNKSLENGGSWITSILIVIIIIIFIWLLAMKRSLDKIEGDIQKKMESKRESEMKNLMMKVNSRETSFVWKVDGFSQKLTDAKNGFNICLYSEPFHTKSCGYKLRLYCYPNGRDDGENTHLSCFHQLMKGEMDDILEWPFVHDVTFLVLNQTDKINHVCHDASWNQAVANSSSKPTSETNLGHGWSKLIPHADLLKDCSPYLQNDVLYIKCIINY